MKMKNMKKTIIGVAIIAMFLITMMGSVNAASMTASTNEVEVNKGVSVTISTNVTMKAVQFKLNYDTSKFEYTGYTSKAGATATVTKTAEGLTFALANSAAPEDAKSIVLNFTAKAETANVNEETFTISGFKAGTSTDKDNNINATATVKVVAAPVVEPEQPENPEKPGNSGNEDNNKPAGDNTDNKGTTTNNNDKVGTNGKVITKLNQTGTPLFIGAAVVVALAGAVLVVRKAK